MSETFRARRGPAALAASAAVTLLLCLGPARAQQEVPRPPCDGAIPLPSYAATGAPPEVGVWSGKPLDDPSLAHVALRGTPPAEAGAALACAGWETMPPFTVALAFRLPGAPTVDDLLARFGAYGDLAPVRYWAASRQRWENLFDQIYAVTDQDSRERRPNHTLAELRAGGDLLAYQDPGGPVGGAVYRTRVREAGPDRLVVLVENVTSARAAGLLPLRPGTLRFAHFLERLPGPEGAWGYYGLVGLGIAPDSARTYVNRAASLFRHMAGIPPEQEPPVWP